MTRKVYNTNDNGRNAIARNLMAPIPFYLKADSSSGPNDEKSSEGDCDVLVHKVCYDPTNADLQTYNIRNHTALPSTCSVVLSGV